MEVRQTRLSGRPENARPEKEGDTEDRRSQDAKENRKAAEGRGQESSEAQAGITPNSAATALAAYVAVDPTSLQLVEQIKQLAPSNAVILLRGENGVGKNLIASLLHYLSPRFDEPILKVDCADLPQDFLEHEIFGHENGALPARRGRLEVAGSGTVVLREIAALTMPVQAKLLRVIEQREFERPGGTSPIKVQARIIALTNVDLEHAVSRRSFREDLYYRLSIGALTVPPLREHPADIQPLAEHFLAQLAHLHRRPKPSLNTSALRALTHYSFPGNVRQLRNILSRVFATTTGPEIREDDLPAFLRARRPMMSLEDLERGYIAEVLNATSGKKSQAAAILGISRKTLLEKRKRYRLD